MDSNHGNPPNTLKNLIIENCQPKKEINYKEACRQIIDEIKWTDPTTTTLEEKVEEIHKVMLDHISKHTEEIPGKKKKEDIRKHKQVRLLKYINRIKTRRKNGLTVGERQ